MSCGQNHKYDAYQKASDALKVALVEALNTDEETSTLKELFEHYLGARTRADKASFSASISGDDTVITFGDSFSPCAAASTAVYDWGDDGISLTGNPYASDTIDFTGIGSGVTTVSAGSGVDTIKLG